MNVRCECACGGSIEIEDASEMTATGLLEAWQSLHSGHRRSESEYRTWIDAIHRRTFE